MDLIVCFTIGIMILIIGIGLSCFGIGFATKRDIQLTKPMIYSGTALIMFSILLERMFK
jgi:hypothetical protein